MQYNRVDTTANRLKMALDESGLRQVDLVRETGIDKGNLLRYLDWLDTKLHILNEEGVNAVDGITFKKLQGYNNLYEIRRTKSTANPRVIYCYFEDSITILLASTKEKNTSDISHEADVALGRLKLIMEE